MHLRSCALGFVILSSLFATRLYAQTDESLNSELNAAEGAAGGQFQPTPSTQELKSDGGPLDAVGIPQEEGAPPKTSKAPVPPPAKEIPPPEIERPAVQPPEPPAPAAEPPPPPEITEQDQAPPEPIVESPPPRKILPQASDRTNKLCNCRFKPGTPYIERRSTISGFFGIEGGTYAPTSYNSQIVSGQTYSSYYSGGAGPNIELVFGAKYNLPLVSVGLQVSGGYFQASNQGSGANLSIIPITVGGIASLDGIFKEPYVVPYGVAGMYTDIWKESGGSFSDHGRTSLAGFYALGLMFQLDWIDPETHESGYKDFGLENTFLFLEARSFLASDDVGIDFSTPLQISGGFRFEF